MGAKKGAVLSLLSQGKGKMEYLVVPHTLELRTRGRLAGVGGAGAGAPFGF